MSDNQDPIPMIEQALAAIGCPPAKTREMAEQLDKRARQVAEEKQQSYEESLMHLLNLMRQGWSAKERGL